MIDHKEFTDTEVFEMNPEIEGSENDDMIFVTERAIEAIQKVRQSNKVPDKYRLRILTQSGGCSGMKYNIGFDDQQNDGDRLLSVNDTEFIIDSKSVFYLMGITLDFQNGPHGTGFVFHNPYKTGTCGCMA